jgi:hypothetical protein
VILPVTPDPLDRKFQIAARRQRQFQSSSGFTLVYPFPTSIADEMREEHRRRVLGE